MPTLFRPCIDLHEGQVKQIVGSTLGSSCNDDSDKKELETNFVAPPEQTAAYFAEMYERDHMVGGHLVMLGPGNEEAALAALRAWPQGLQLGGGIMEDNAMKWLDAGASKVIVTSWLFPDCSLNMERLRRLSELVTPDRLVVDLSCCRTEDPDGNPRWFVAMDKWRKVTTTEITAETLNILAPYCSEFLIHAAHVEGKCSGIDEELVRLLGAITPEGKGCTYAGGARRLEDLAAVDSLSKGRVDLTIGSALDVFGGTHVRYADCVSWNEEQRLEDERMQKKRLDEQLHRRESKPESQPPQTISKQESRNVTKQDSRKVTKQESSRLFAKLGSRNIAKQESRVLGKQESKLLKKGDSRRND